MERMMRYSFVLVVCSISFLGGGYCCGQHLSSVNQAYVYREGAPAAVNLNGRFIVTLRSFLLATNPQQRAAVTSERLDALLRTTYVGKVSNYKLSDGLVVDVDGAPMIYLTPNDIDTTKRENLDSITAQVAVRLGAVLKEAKALTESTALIRAIVFAAGATVLFLVLLRFLIVGYRRIHGWFHRTIRKKAESSRVAGIVSGSESNITFLIVGRTLLIVAWSVACILFYAWATYVFEQFPVTRPWSEGTASSILDAVRWVLGGILTALPGLATVVVIMVATRGITQVVGFLLKRIESGDVALSWIDTDTVLPTRRIIVVVIGIFAVVGLMLSFGTTGVIGQAASGCILMYSRVIRVGEFVKNAEHLGTVKRIGFFNTVLHNPYLEAVSVPNSVILDPSKRRVTVSSLHGNIQDVFNENGQQIMSPHNITDPSAPKVVPPKDWDPPITNT